MKKITALIFSAILFVSPLSSASADDGQALTRGEFFKLVVDHLGYDATNVKVELPKDIAADSPYVAAAKILKDKKIVVGFADGTFKPNQTITSAEASSVVARFLGITGDAKSALAADYGITFDNNTVSLEEAQELVSKALTSDDEALAILDKMTFAQNEQNSYQATGTMDMEFKMKEGTAEIPELADGMKMSSEMELSFNKEKGLHQTVTTTVPNPMTNEQQEMVIEQYYVPEGIFMKMLDPISGENQWLDLSGTMPISFEDLIKMNEDNMNVMNELNRKYFFYRDLGTEQMNGVNHYKLAFSGKITSLEEIMGMMSSALGDQSEGLLSSLEAMPNMEMAMNGYIWIDEKTMLPSRQTAQYEIKFGESKDPAMIMPFDSIAYELDYNFSNFNNVADIALPEEAKNAEKMPGLDELPEQGTIIGQ